MDLRRLRTDLLALCLLALCVFLALCLWSYDAADPPARPAMAANECSDWIWRADLHRSVCKRQSAG